MSKTILFSDEAREKLKVGVDTVANAVAVTLGPKGRNVIIKTPLGSPHITKDGVTVARAIELSCPIEDLGAQMVKDVSSKTADVAGDGTTTSAVLAQAIVSAGLKNITAGANPMDLKKGIDKAVKEVVRNIKGMATQIDTDSERVKQVATISANGDEEIGSMLAEAMSVVGRDGIITVEEANGTVTEVEAVRGMQFKNGYLSPYFVTDVEKDLVSMKDPYILTYDGTISSMEQILPLLEEVSATKKGLLIISEDIDPEVLATLAVNRVKGLLSIAAVKSPGFGKVRLDMLEDISILTGSTLISSEKGMNIKEATIDMLGSSARVEVTKDETTIVNGKGSKKPIKSRVEHIRNLLSKCTVDHDKEKLQERLAKLAGGVAAIYVGATTEVEMREKKDRVDDALEAIRSAVEEGVVPGGGVTLIKCIKVLENLRGDNEDEDTGISIIRKALEAPLRQIVSNTGVDAGVVIQKVKEGEGSFGYDARAEVYGDLFIAGVIDPAKVTRTAIENAASIASMLLTTECVIVDEI